MRVLIDTNIFISTALKPDGTVAKAYYKATKSPFEGVVCDYCINELRYVATTKLSKYITEVEKFIATVLLSCEIIDAPVDCYDNNVEIRDAKDLPILHAAIEHNIDIILTGDKDFLTLTLKKPKSISPTDFLLLE